MNDKQTTRLAFLGHNFSMPTHFFAKMTYSRTYSVVNYQVHFFRPRQVPGAMFWVCLVIHYLTIWMVDAALIPVSRLHPHIFVARYMRTTFL
jgi:hypothetical protein